MLSSAQTASMPSLPSGVLIPHVACSLRTVTHSWPSAFHALLLLPPSPAPRLLYALPGDTPALLQLLRHVTKLPALDAVTAFALVQPLPGVDSILLKGTAAASCSLPGLYGPLLPAPAPLFQTDVLQAKSWGEHGPWQTEGCCCWLCCCSHAGSQVPGCCNAANGAISTCSGSSGTSWSSSCLGAGFAAAAFGDAVACPGGLLMMVLEYCHAGAAGFCC
ncbi:hypothetical protein COO60DRAFT_1228415 [Scenedesmus sp. NREL 46B-D3]|nr:hypothetical protein COO60DRAFT_1228415 [Scenedesmus sp. NREL 46B-D3]